MKLFGISIPVKGETIIPIIREDSTTFFAFKPLESFDGFDKLIPGNDRVLYGGVPGEEMKKLDPVPAITMQDFKVKYLLHWLFVNSLVCVYQDESSFNEETAKIEIIRKKSLIVWEQIDMKDLTTYPKVSEELKALGIEDREIDQLYIGAQEANSLRRDLMEEARENFTRLTPEVQVKEMTS